MYSQGETVSVGEFSPRRYCSIKLYICLLFILLQRLQFSSNSCGVPYYLNPDTIPVITFSAHHPTFKPFYYTQPSTKHQSDKMKSFAAITLLALAVLGLASPMEQQQVATCATCSQGCLRTDTGSCYPNWPQEVCNIYTGVRYPPPTSILVVNLY